MGSTLPTLSEIQTLVTYLPRLYADGFTPVLEWHGGEKDQDGIIHLPYPEYHPLVLEFFRTIGSECWLDYGYQPQEAYDTLQDEARLRSASLTQVKTLLTYCLRGERFSDGHWEEMILKGYIRRILERLIDLGAGLE